jgi:hypothetical protein
MVQAALTCTWQDPHRLSKAISSFAGSISDGLVPEDLDLYTLVEYLECIIQPLKEHLNNKAEAGVNRGNMTQSEGEQPIQVCAI